jgi:peptidoglycan/xylan/chitin deacetylase (PgdA/CDA1 family)
MRILHKRGLPVISLDSAIDKLREDGIENGETAITFDDGWASNLSVIPVLEEYGYRACIYITTEHLNASTEAFNVVIAQMAHRSPKNFAELLSVHPLLDGKYQLKPDPAAAIIRLISAAEKIDLAERQRLLPALADLLGLDYQQFMRGGRFRFLSGIEIQALARRGIDIQLHTHTHFLPTDSFESMAMEIARNREAIAELTGVAANHFCYPSGVHSARHPAWLERLGIVSATTCDAGFNDAADSPLLLKRFLDSESVSDIEFEAEVAGVRELLRNLRQKVRSRWKS